MRNSYATLAEYKAYVVARGQTASTDAADDAVIESLLEQASRHIDDETGRVFYPFVQTLLLDVPDGRELFIGEDLLEVISISNGGTALASTEYYLVPYSYSPAYALRIREKSIYYWETNSDAEAENAISVTGIYGYHDKYSREAWKVGTVTTEALDVSEVEFDVSSSSLFSAGQIIRYGNEISAISSVASGKITVASRGDNGSTVAIHDSGITVYIWQPMKTASMAVLETALTAYHRRFGKSMSNIETITAAGVVLTPRDYPAAMRSFILNHKDML